ncbi:MAG: hypothetical protein VKL39_07615 [Leptolyngbyaceae bacterium]|nr:hypothetical protein [Leptolyngbyaceae bacterium]
MVVNIQNVPNLKHQTASEGKSFSLDSVLGVTIFDLNGLPKEYYGTVENDDTSWIQVVFQTLGLELLFESAFQLGHFQYSIIHDTPNPAIVFKLRTYCVAFLLSPVNFRDVADRIAAQINHFDPSLPISDPRFSVVVKP